MKANQIKTAIVQAMNNQVAFSWVNNHKVQKGVYIELPQELFASLFNK